MVRPIHSLHILVLICRLYLHKSFEPPHHKPDMWPTVRGNEAIATSQASSSEGYILLLSWRADPIDRGYSVDFCWSLSWS